MKDGAFATFGLGNAPSGQRCNPTDFAPLGGSIYCVEMNDHLLDHLPLEILIALQEALADPTADGQERARLRALDSGMYLHCLRRPDGKEGVNDPLPMGAAEDDVEAIQLVFY